MIVLVPSDGLDEAGGFDDCGGAVVVVGFFDVVVVVRPEPLESDLGVAVDEVVLAVVGVVEVDDWGGAGAVTVVEGAAAATAVSARAPAAAPGRGSVLAGDA